MLGLPYVPVRPALLKEYGEKHFTSHSPGWLKSHAYLCNFDDQTPVAVRLVLLRVRPERSRASSAPPSPVYFSNNAVIHALQRKRERTHSSPSSRTSESSSRNHRPTTRTGTQLSTSANCAEGATQLTLLESMKAERHGESDGRRKVVQITAVGISTVST